MNSRFYLVWILGIGLWSGLSAEPNKPGHEFSSSKCGQDVHIRDVLVLDLESFQAHPGEAQEFVDRRAGDFILINTKPEVIITPQRPSMDPDGVFRRAQKYGAKKGCDLVLVLRTGPYFGRQRGWKSRPKDQGYAFVVLGHRTE